MRIVPVVLSGGIGSRLWPVSRSTTPKQLQRLLGDHSMIQATVLRVTAMEEADPPIVVCNHSHTERVLEQFREIGVEPALTIGERDGRNTAPAVAAAALAAPPHTLLLVLPADHVVTDVAAFREAIRLAATAAEDGSLVTFGVVPHRPETGYGYIRMEDGEGPVRRVAEFVEKPDRATAERYLQSGKYLWNSGMFLFTPAAVLGEMERHAPEVEAAVRKAVAEADLSAGLMQLGPSFLESPPISIDHAVMEHTRRAKVVPLDAGWSDVGSWATLWEIEERDEDENVVRGEAEVLDVHRSYVRSSGRLVAVVGLDDVVVVDTGDAVLVAARDRVQDVRAVVDALSAKGRPEVE